MNADWAALLDLLLAPLPPGEALRVRRAWVGHRERRLREGDLNPYRPQDVRSAAADALLEALTEHAQDGEPDWRLVLWVDWKAWDEVEWQAGLMARTRGLPDAFHWERREGEGVEDALAAFAMWLRPLGHRYLSWERGEDAHFGFVVPEVEVATFVAAARRAGLDVPG